MKVLTSQAVASGRGKGTGLAGVKKDSRLTPPPPPPPLASTKRTKKTAKKDKMSGCTIEIVAEHTL